MSVARIAAARFRISGDARMIDSLREDVSRHPNDFVSFNHWNTPPGPEGKCLDSFGSAYNAQQCSND
jgi:hypothetical protein